MDITNKKAIGIEFDPVPVTLPKPPLQENTVEKRTSLVAQKSFGFIPKVTEEELAAAFEGVTLELDDDKPVRQLSSLKAAELYAASRAAGKTHQAARALIQPHIAKSPLTTQNSFVKKESFEASVARRLAALRK